MKSRAMKMWKAIPSPVLLLGTLCLLTGCASVESSRATPVQFGVVTDCQYDDRESRGERHYRSCPRKLAEAVEQFNSDDLDFVIQLGDFVDRGFDNIPKLLKTWQELSADSFHVLGNHDFSVEERLKIEVPKVLGMEARYYWITYGAVRFVILDTNDLSLYSYPADDKRTIASRAVYDEYSAAGVTHEKYNGGIGRDQLRWLEGALAEADRLGQDVVLMAHHPVYPDNDHNLWNAGELLDVIDKHKSVIAWFSGHNHAGNYGVRQGVHYITFSAMLDTEETAYASVLLDGRRIRVSGFGRQSDYDLRSARD